MHVAVRIGGQQRVTQLAPRPDGFRQTVAPTGAALADAFQLMPLGEIAEQRLLITHASLRHVMARLFFAGCACGEEAGRMGHLALKHEEFSAFHSVKSR